MGHMTEDGVETAVRQAIGGDEAAISWVLAHADTMSNAVVMALAALLEGNQQRLASAERIAATSRDRQVVAVGRAYLAGDHALVDALARDHLVDHPDSLIVSWIACDAIRAARRHTGPARER